MEQLKYTWYTRHQRTRTMKRVHKVNTQLGSTFDQLVNYDGICHHHFGLNSHLAQNLCHLLTSQNTFLFSQISFMGGEITTDYICSHNSDRGKLSSCFRKQ